ncbi:tRNA (guanosine(37)-N1)-methyltransferase TrmD [Teredinibacter haidensis]|uniref:tRNA (guanosine(37)-N1)-methyltransferase TrmD n=1 Tax=Teredinibacter haidensis TaxID=2731755 RepID=UPI000948B8EC|nr:tRNA (guanosine(37)-N1)-methyltransferase TrmD [Teredinibacter haidensis]
MKATVITLFPEMFRAITESGITRRAVERGLIELDFINPREFTHDRHQTVDDRPYGGGPGMVMRVEPLAEALSAACERLSVAREDVKVIYLSPQGKTLNRGEVAAVSDYANVVLIAGRYEGIDERFIDTYVDEEISIGDYVLSGGELPAMVLLDALIRKLPGALGDDQSAEQDSFEDGLLDCPHYTRPEEVEGKRVPDVLLSGDHKRIENWRLQQSLGRTLLRRPDLLKAKSLSPAQQKLLDAFVEQRVELKTNN